MAKWRTLSAALAVMVMGTFALSTQAQETLTNKGAGDRVSGKPWSTRSAVLGRNGMAATSHPLASQIAIDILKSGGTAVDAAIAANAALGLMEPTGNGIGGDLFAIIWDPKSGRLHGLNASGRSPIGQDLSAFKAAIASKAKNFDADALLNAARSPKAKAFFQRMIDGTEIPNWGSLSVTVPGAVDGWFEMHQRFGRLPMRRILAPTVAYARDGFPVTEVVAYYLEGSRRSFERLHAAGMIEEIDNYRATYLIDGAAPQEGAIFKNPDLANTLEMIGKRGRDAFYNGPLADVMAAYFQRIDAPMTKADLAAHKSDWVTPLSVNYRGYDVFELPPNGQGIAALQMLNMLEPFDLQALGHNSADYLHLMTEVKKRAFEDRAKFYADPDFYDAPLDRLLSKDYAKLRMADYTPGQAANQVDHGDIKLAEGDTIYMTVADKDGMMVSLIQSNYRGQGAGLVPDGLGFMLQDRGALFALTPGHANVYAAGKRPFHTIIPAFVMKDGKPWMSFGLMGGAMQPQGHVQIIANMVDFGMTVQAAGDAARYHHTGSTEPLGHAPMDDGGVLEIESGIGSDVVATLEGRGHVVRYAKGPFGGYQAIYRDPDTGVYWGASEMRKDGQAIGY